TRPSPTASESPPIPPPTIRILRVFCTRRLRSHSRRAYPGPAWACQDNFFLRGILFGGRPHRTARQQALIFRRHGAAGWEKALPETGMRPASLPTETRKTALHGGLRRCARAIGNARQGAQPA